MEICSLASGSSGNSYLIKHQSTTLLLDAGLSGKRIAEAALFFEVELKNIRGILLTHEHSDHIQSAGILSRRFNLPLYMTPGTLRGAVAVLGQVREDNIILVSPGETYTLGDLEFIPFRVRHDAQEPVAYCFNDGKRRSAVLTDVGRLDDSEDDLFPETKSDCFVNKLLQGCHGLVLEANHDPKMLATGSYPLPVKRRIAGDTGHLSNLQAAQILLRLYRGGRLQKFALAHLSANNNVPEMAAETVASYLCRHGIDVPQPIILPRDRIGPALQVI